MTPPTIALILLLSFGVVVFVVIKTQLDNQKKVATAMANLGAVNSSNGYEVRCGDVILRIKPPTDLFGSYLIMAANPSGKIIGAKDLKDLLGDHWTEYILLKDRMTTPFGSGGFSLSIDSKNICLRLAAKRPGKTLASAADELPKCINIVSFAIARLSRPL